MGRSFASTAAVILSIGLLAGCNQNNQNQAAQNAPPAPAPGTPTQTSQPKAPMPAIPRAPIGIVTPAMTSVMKDFVPAADMIFMYEIQSAKIATMRAQNPQIKMFAQDMLDEYTADQKEFTAIVDAQKGKADIPAKLDDRRQLMISNLQKIGADNFDARFVRQQTNAHEEAVVIFTGYSNGGDNAALKKFAADELDKVKDRRARVLGLWKLPKQAGGNDLVPSPE